MSKKNTRQRASLPSVKKNTRQRRVCRVPEKQHSANHLTLGKEPVSGSEEGFWGFWADVGFFRFWVFAEGPDPGPSAKMFLFFLKKFFAECPWPSSQQRQSLPSAKLALGKFSIFFCFFDPKFFVGPAYIVYSFMFKFGAFSSFFVIFD